MKHTADLIKINAAVWVWSLDYVERPRSGQEMTYQDVMGGVDKENRSCPVKTQTGNGKKQVYKGEEHAKQ